MGEAGTGRDGTAYTASDWTLAQLLALKGDRTISVVVPARDEEATVGAVVERLVADLVTGASGLVGGGGGLDAPTGPHPARAPAPAGGRVEAAAAIRSDLGSVPGKGEALWKSQFVTRGDLVVFVDADLVDWGTHFVTGLLGPLLVDEDVHLVKAVYDRPMIDAEGREEETGGRVTELVARPWLALHRPELAGIVQPLSGEWAIRRSALASFAVPVGYGVEIAALIDTADAFGVQGIAQVDLGRRTHRHHRHDTLGLMAVQVLAAADRRRVRPVDEPDAAAPGIDEIAVLTQYARRSAGFEPVTTSVGIGERPPAASC